MFGRASTSKKIIAVADVGSGSAAVALFAITGGMPAVAIAASRVALPFEERSAEATERGIIAVLSEAAERSLAAYAASDHKNAPIKSVYAVIRTPWTRSKTERAASTMAAETRITSAMIGSLAQQAIKNDKELDLPLLIESSVVRVELNGYPTASPIGKLAKSLCVDVLMSDCDASLKAGVDETLRRIFPGAKATLRSGTRALISGVENLSGIGKDYVILDIEGEASGMVVVRDGLANEHVLIPEGVRSIVRRISEKGMPEETLSLLRMMEREESADNASHTFAESVARAELELARVYGEGLTKAAAISRLPTDLILITHPDLVPWLTTFFSRIDFSQCTLTAQPFNVRPLKAGDFEGVVAREGQPIDIGLSIAGALVNSEARS